MNEKDNSKDSIWTSIRQRAEELKESSLEKKRPSKEEKERIFKERARKLSERWHLEDSKERFTCITFQISSEYYAVSAFNITEIFKTDKISFIPCLPPCFAGMTNHRGKPLTVLNLASLFNLPEKSPSSDSSSGNKIVVVEDGGLYAGILVDQIDGLVELQLSQIKKISSVLADKNSYIHSEVLLNNRQTHIIDVTQLLTSKSLTVNQIK